MDKVTVVGLDLAKAVFQVHAVDAGGEVVMRRQLRRSRVLPFFAQLPACLVGMEACGGAHDWARKLQAQGHTVRLIPPQYVKPYVKTNKTDAADAEAISEAVQRPSMHFVPIKTEDQQAILAVHRARAEFVKMRTATANHIRGLLAEFGHVLPVGVHHLTQAREALGDETLPEVFRALIQRQLAHLREIGAHIEALEAQIKAWHAEHEASQRLMAVPGVGILTATAIVASVGDASQFRNARHRAAWLGLVPKQHSSGGKPHLQGMSKRGDVYLRTLLIHGSRSVLRYAAHRPDAERSWHVQVLRRRNPNIAAVALAHKNARTIWALLAKHQRYDPTRRRPVAQRVTA